ncbi:MAG TPA: DUF192 domain-containing protein [Actinomycetota bacterium]|nr:DUF192 domain-containing protein [Actinomycetota bacterium]
MAVQMHSLPRAALSLVLMTALWGCTSPSSETESSRGGGGSSAKGPAVTAQPETKLFNRGLPTADVQIVRGNQALLDLQVEIAETPDVQASGLMNVRDLPPTAGMVFLFQAPARSSFHMKDTLIPLDIAFWDERMVIVDILQMVPCEQDPCQIYTPSHDYVAALEVNRGLLASKGVRLGDRVMLTRT